MPTTITRVPSNQARNQRSKDQQSKKENLPVWLCRISCGSSRAESLGERTKAPYELSTTSLRRPGLLPPPMCGTLMAVQSCCATRDPPPPCTGCSAPLVEAAAPSTIHLLQVGAGALELLSLCRQLRPPKIHLSMVGALELPLTCCAPEERRTWPASGEDAIRRQRSRLLK